METNPLYGTDVWKRLYQRELSKGYSPEDAERRATAMAQPLVDSVMRDERMAGEASSNNAAVDRQRIVDDAKAAASANPRGFLGLPSRESMKSFLIERGMDPETAENRAGHAAAHNARQGATTLAIGAGSAASAVPRAMEIVNGLDKAGRTQMFRTSTGQMRNFAQNAPTLIRDAAGKIVKLAPGEAVPAGATVLNVAEAPVAATIAGTAGAFGVPAALAYQRSDGKSESTTPAPVDVGYVDPMGVSAYSPSPIVEQALAKTAPAATSASVVNPAPTASQPDYGPFSDESYSADPSKSIMSQYEKPDVIASRARPAGPQRTTTPVAAQTAQKPQEPWYARFMPTDPYAGMSAAKLMDRANANPDDPAAFFRADAMLRKERPEMFDKKPEEGMARGGTAGGGGHGKDATIMKALEIIHHMLRTR